MRYLAILCLALCQQLCFGQSEIGSDINSAKFNQQSDTSETHEIRKVPEGYRMGFPYYESLGSKDGKFIHYEFFRLDSARYYVREYFKNGRIKSIGIEAIDKNVLDSVVVDVFLADGTSKVPSYVSPEHLLLKEGEWTEFDDDTLPSFFWKGTYLDNKKTGLWKRLLNFDKDTVVLEETDFEKNSTKIVPTDNGIHEKSLADLKKLLQGKWSDWSCNNEGITRSFKESLPGYIYRKDGIYLNNSYYEFNRAGIFIKQFVKGCDTTSQLLKRGMWNLLRSGDQTFIDLIFKDGVVWEMNLLYYSEDAGLVMNLNKHPNTHKMK